MRVGILFAQFAPYHIDRCAAAARALAGIAQVDAVEVATGSATYAWDPSGDIAGATKHVLFPGTRFEQTGGWARFAAAWRRLRRCRIVFVGLSYTEAPTALLALALRLTGRHVVMMNDSKFDDKPRRIAGEWIKSILCLPYSGAIVAGGRHAEYLRFLGFRRRPLVIGYDTVDLARVRASSPPPDVAFTSRYFVFVGRFVAKKNLPFLIHAYARYVALAGDAARPLVLVGAGEEEPAIRAAIIDHALGGRVKIEGFLQADGVAGTLSRALALLLPSVEEQWGLVVNEALAFDLPVIVSDQVGSRDTLVHNLVNGYVVDASCIEGWAKAMLALATDEAHWSSMSRASAALAPAGDVARFGEAVVSMVDRFAPAHRFSARGRG